MRPTWTGQLSIGLLTIPVHLNPAVKEHDAGFKLLHKDCGQKIGVKRYCPTHEIIDWSAVDRSVEIARGTYLPLTDGELDSLPLPTSGAIHVEGFLPRHDVPARRKAKVHYLTPGKGGEKGYALLHRVMEAESLAAVGKVNMRGNEQLVSIEPDTDRVLACWYLHWEDEVVSTAAVGIEPVDLKANEIALGTTLVTASEFSLSLQGLDEIPDETQTALQALITAKAEGMTLPASAQASGQVVNLMDAIRASIEMKRGAA